MNVKIPVDLHTKLSSEFEFKEYLFGSHLHGVSSEDSDKDLIRVIPDDFYSRFQTLAIYFPNIHSFQYDDVENNDQYIWMTESQFYRGLFSGDGNMIADVVLLTGEFDDPLILCRTYKVIKGYLGVAKRDIKLHPNSEKKVFHAERSLMMAEYVLNGEIPKVQDIVNLKRRVRSSADSIRVAESLLRSDLNDRLDRMEISMYPKFVESDPLVEIMNKSNNIKEFKY